MRNTEEGGFDHTHLIIEEWAGAELCSESQGDKLINQVKIYCWKNKEKGDGGHGEAV